MTSLLREDVVAGLHHERHANPRRLHHVDLTADGVHAVIRNQLLRPDSRTIDDKVIALIHELQMKFKQLHWKVMWKEKINNAHPKSISS